jgi:hypothetical protein
MVYLLKTWKQNTWLLCSPGDNFQTYCSLSWCLGNSQHISHAVLITKHSVNRWSAVVIICLAALLTVCMFTAVVLSCPVLFIIFRQAVPTHAVQISWYRSDGLFELCHIVQLTNPDLMHYLYCSMLSRQQYMYSVEHYLYVLWHAVRIDVKFYLAES